MQEPQYPTKESAYQLISAIGYGASGLVIHLNFNLINIKVWKAQITEGTLKGVFVALKRVDLNKCGESTLADLRVNLSKSLSNLTLLQKSILVVNKMQHPHLLQCVSSFLSKNALVLVSPLMTYGSLEHILHYKYSKGVSDLVLIASILKQTLLALSYLHMNQQLHRAVKASNIFISKDGNVKLSDFGLTAKVTKNKKRQTLVGSPCWMAPEILDESCDGYDLKADIWSFGITAIELAQGQPPYSDLLTMKVILKIVNDEPPQLENLKQWDESFKELLNSCLVKDPKLRKNADQLLKLKFFKLAKSADYIKEKLLANIPPVEQTVSESIKNQGIEQLKNFNIAVPAEEQKIVSNSNNNNNIELHYYYFYLQKRWDFQLSDEEEKIDIQEQRTDLPQKQESFYSTKLQSQNQSRVSQPQPLEFRISKNFGDNPDELNLDEEETSN